MSSFTGLLVYSDKPIFRTGRHLFIILTMILLFSWIVYLRDDSGAGYLQAMKGVSLNALFFFGYAYITAYILVPLLLNRKKYFWFFLTFLASGIIISYIKFIFSDIVFYSAIAADISARFRQVELPYLVTNTKDMTFIVALFLIAKYAKDNHYLQMRLRELRDHQLRAEIKLLQHQMDPHVIFNHLNNIYSLAVNNYDRVGDSIRRFHSLLSYYFITGKNRVVDLNAELRAIEDFITLEKFRYGKRLSISYSVAGESKERKIIPFVFFSLVENCFEHGCSIESGSSWIKIDVRIEGRAILFHAANSKPQNILVATSSVDPYTVTKQKLDLLYPGKYLLRIDDRQDRYSVDLKLRI